VEIPTSLRPAIAHELAKVVRGEMPEMLTWVNDYGGAGATLIDQPDDIWTHRWSDAVEVGSGGGWHVVLPLWTTDEAPSDLSIELVIGSDGSASVQDLHVL
jgi:hypothetical protein